jgi:His-Xaa-Ser system radical SAM maturase HxsC
MQLKIASGHSNQDNGYLYGIITNNPNSIDKHKMILYLEEPFNDLPVGFLGYVLVKKNIQIKNSNKLTNVKVFTIDKPLMIKFDQILIKIDFINNIIWQLVDLLQNHIDLYLTGKCTQFCIACPQPKEFRKNLSPKEEALFISEALINQKKHINISGGEPTFNKKYFISVLKTLQVNSPESTLQILTNALAFSKEQFITKILNEGIYFEKLFFSIAIYGSNSELQDIATGYKGSFYQLEDAINNIYKYNAKIELRIVINKMNYKDLLNIAKLIVEKYKDKITRVIFMGLEMSGDAGENQEKVWVSFEEHNPSLKDSIIYLLTNNVQVLLYNYPLCFLPNQFWSLAKDSISYWKKFFIAECNGCQLKSICAGFFESTLPYIKEVNPILRKD